MLKNQNSKTMSPKENTNLKLHNEHFLLFILMSLLRDVISRVVGDRDVAVIDSGAAVEKRVESLLDEYCLRAEADNTPTLEFITFADDEYRQRLQDKAMTE